MAKRRGLGRGLDALLSAGEPAAPAGSGGLRQIPIEQMRRGRYQPRLRMDPQALEELTRSIRAQGVVQPIVVRPLPGPDSEFEIIAGERRWRAAQAAGLETVPAVVREVEDDAALAMSLIENIQREDLSPIEEANALARFVEEFSVTHQQAAEAVGRSRASVSNLLRLLDLAPEVRSMLEEGELEMGQARALLGLEGPLQLGAAREVVAKGLTTRQTEALVRRRRALEDAPPLRRQRAATADADVRRLEQQLSERLGAPVQIDYAADGRGRLVIRFSSLDEFEGIVERIH